MKGFCLPVILAFIAPLLLAGCNDEEDEIEKLANLAPAAGGPKAQLSLIIRDFSYSFVEGRHRYTHVREFVESAGVAVTITRGRVCVERGKSCVDALVTYNIPAGGRFIQQDHYVATPAPADEITLQYWATDSSGNTHELNTSLQTKMEEVLQDHR